jgi:vitellogenic carboxypeptidase-like protein
MRFAGVLLVLLGLGVVSAFRRPIQFPEMPIPDGVNDGPLFLTPYLRQGRPDLARSLSLVPPSQSPNQIESHTGFITVNDSLQSNMFFWCARLLCRKIRPRADSFGVPGSFRRRTRTPRLLCCCGCRFVPGKTLLPLNASFLSRFLQGGPGGSSLFGMFVEHGPWTVNNDMTLAVNPNTWSNQYSMLYIDNPVGKLRTCMKCRLASAAGCSRLALGSRCLL